MRGLFIVFDGLDGAGKGTALRGARSFLIAKGIPEEKMLVTAEPTGGLHGKKLREMLSQQVNPEVNARQFLDLYIADRKEHTESEILPAISAGKIILCDRYKYSTFVYQGLQGIPLEKIRGLHAGMPVPDITFILDLPAETALERISRRKRREVFEEIGFMEKVRQGFLSLKRAIPEENIVVVDASRSIRDVRGEINATLEKLIATAGN
ncbi:MAG: dTMP kinase [Candidatus Diapherotrites archaeon]|uniref:Probable thymidylate kinase n=1 Tax=Candidatus Iainarchaeum sp. TaxID=3101447 RepID=A0A8T3YN60_9ARCH|nr:dTMP kinase [Candidatus Diapherotrites archaeon]